MQLPDKFCYALLSICVTASYVRSENPSSHRSLLPTQRAVERPFSKRDAPVMIIEDVSDESEDVMKNKRAMSIYRGKSKKKFIQPKPKYKPTAADYRQPLASFNKAHKTYKIMKSNQVKSKSKAPVPIAEINRPFRQKNRVKSNRQQMPVNRPMIKPTEYYPRPTPHSELEPAGFGEPPNDYNEASAPTYMKRLVNSYSELNPSPGNKHQNHEDYNDYYDSVRAATPALQHWKNHGDYDKNVDLPYSKYFVHHSGTKDDIIDDQFAGSEVASFGYDHTFTGNKNKRGRDGDTTDKTLTQQWNYGESGKVVVGGQYAEPPARVVPNFQPSASMFLEDTDSFNPVIGNSFFETAHAPQVSPYVNYKNSNLAFSPQNLNDVFGIVERRKRR